MTTLWHNIHPGNCDPYAAENAEAANVDTGVAVELIASVEEVLAAMLTHSHSNTHIHRF